VVAVLQQSFLDVEEWENNFLSSIDVLRACVSLHLPVERQQRFRGRDSSCEVSERGMNGYIYV
jgi:hypothetical protein